MQRQASAHTDEPPMLQMLSYKHEVHSTLRVQEKKHIVQNSSKEENNMDLEFRNTGSNLSSSSMVIVVSLIAI